MNKSVSELMALLGVSESAAIAMLDAANADNANKAKTRCEGKILDIVNAAFTKDVLNDVLSELGRVNDSDYFAVVFTRQKGTFRVQIGKKRTQEEKAAATLKKAGIEVELPKTSLNPPTR